MASPGCSAGGGLMFPRCSKQLIWAQHLARSPEMKGRRPDDWQARWLVGGLYDCFRQSAAALKETPPPRRALFMSSQGRVHAVRGPPPAAARSPQAACGHQKLDTKDGQICSEGAHVWICKKVFTLAFVHFYCVWLFYKLRLIWFLFILFLFDSMLSSFCLWAAVIATFYWDY